MLERVQSELNEAVRLAREKMKSRYSRELIDVVFSQPYTRIRHVEAAGIAKRNAASLYLRELERIGILRGVAVGRERLFLNHRLMSALTLEPATPAL
jgi:Fic family protein